MLERPVRALRGTMGLALAAILAASCAGAASQATPRPSAGMGIGPAPTNERPVASAPMNACATGDPGPAAPAEPGTPDANGVVVTRTSLRNFQSGSGLTFQLIVEVENRGPGHVRIDDLTNNYTIHDTSGRVLMGGSFIYVFPQVLEPGGFGYFVEGDRVYPSGTSADVVGEVELGITSGMAPGPADAYAVNDVLVSGGALPEVSGSVINDTSRDAAIGIVGVILFGSAGEILAGLYDNTSIATIAAGQARGFRAVYPPTPPISQAEVGCWKAFAFDSVLPEVATPAVVSIDDVPVGACFNEDTDPTTGGIAAVLVLCDSPHQHEKIGQEVLPDVQGAPFPGIDAITERANAICLPLFQAYVGTEPDPAALTYWYLIPDETAWGNGQRTLTCTAGFADRSMQAPGSVKHDKQGTF